MGIGKIPLYYSLLLSKTSECFRIRVSWWGKVDSICIFLRLGRKKIKVSLRSSPQRSTVRWTVEFEWVRIQFRIKQKAQSFRTGLGGGRWIRTTEAISSRFTVCPLWPLGNSPRCSVEPLRHTQHGYYTTDPEKVKRKFEKRERIFGIEKIPPYYSLLLSKTPECFRIRVSWWGKKVWMRSSPHPVTVRRTVTFKWVRIQFRIKQKAQSFRTGLGGGRWIRFTFYFAWGEIKLRCPCGRARMEQQSTGLSHLSGFESSLG